MKSKEKKPMSLSKRILSVILKVLVALLCLVVIAVAVFAVMFRDAFMNIVKNPSLIPYVIENIGSLSRGLNTSTDDLDAEVKANAEAQAKAFAEADINLTESDIGNLSNETLTEEERAAIIYNAMTSGNSSEQSQTETITTNDGMEENTEQPKQEDDTAKEQPKPDDVSTGKQEPEKEPSSDKKEDTVTPAVTEKPAQNVPEKSEQKTPSDKVPTKPAVTAPVEPPATNPLIMTDEQYNKRVSELVAKMYSIKADFVSQLAAFESRIIAEYKALPAEQRTAATKSRIVSDNMSYVMGLEAQCDAQVKAVTDELTAIMTANGKPTTLVDQINAAYINEKEIKKAYYVSMYK